MSQPGRVEPITLDRLRRYAVTRSLFRPTTLAEAIARLGFVQADPIRAPARAQDLTLRHRVRDYRAGDLERRYPALEVEEDVFVNYGFLPREVQQLLHPRIVPGRWSPSRRRKAEELLEFVRSRGAAHPREVDAHFSHGSVTNWFGGSSNATTHLLEEMRYRGLVRVVRRDRGIRVYGPAQLSVAGYDASIRKTRIDALVDVIVAKYAPLPAATLADLVNRLRYGAPQLSRERAGAVSRARKRLPSIRIAGVDWFWPAGERVDGRHTASDERVRLLAPFDPIAWDRRRFELFWEWAYRFEAYTPAPKRKLGYYALPLLWIDRVIGWASVSGTDRGLAASFGYVAGAPPRSPAFRRELEAELGRLERFLTPRSSDPPPD